MTEALQSMTGYGSGTAKVPGGLVSVEVRSVNQRFLDVNLKGPREYVALERELELIQWLDVLGFDEIYVGEHHSAGWETIASPELFLAVAAERTRYIRLGTGVISLPYHHPLMVANRMVQLDHLTRGRVILGVGPGALAPDALMPGTPPERQTTGRQAHAWLSAGTARWQGVIATTR